MLRKAQISKVRTLIRFGLLLWARRRRDLHSRRAAPDGVSQRGAPM